MFAFGIVVLVDKLTISPGLGFVVLIKSECVVGTMIGASVISGLFLARPHPVDLTLGTVVSGKALGDFLFFRCRERSASFSLVEEFPA